MNFNKKSYRLVIGIASIILGVFLIRIFIDGVGLFSANVDYSLTGQIGDFIGGVIGTFFSAAGFYLLYVTLQEQRESFEQERFESKFYELIRLHRENVSEMEYTKFNITINDFSTSKSRKVFSEIFKEFLECYAELLSFHKMLGQPEFMTNSYKEKLEDIIKRNKIYVSANQFAQIDIAYCIVFYGVSIENEPILQHLFRKKIINNYYYKLIKYFQLKCKKENVVGFDEWNNFYKKPKEERLLIFNEIYINRRKFENQPDEVIDTLDDNLIYNFKNVKYYGGHQHRLGHYFRHLFQSFKFLNEQDKIKDKYSYGKTFRAQLSTYEQSLLFINSLSSIGRRWEFDPEIKDLYKLDDKQKELQYRKYRLITNYQLIKNVPGTHIYKIRYKRFYPWIKFESYENQN